jgi:hypothetical protein
MAIHEREQYPEGACLSIQGRIVIPQQSYQEHTLHQMKIAKTQQEKLETSEPDKREFDLSVMRRIVGTLTRDAMRAATDMRGVNMTEWIFPAEENQP